MTLIEFANLFNISGLGMLLTLALVVSSRYRARFFGFWMTGYGAGLVTLVLEAIAIHWTRHPVLTAVEALATLTATACFFATARTLREGDASWPLVIKSTLLAEAAFVIMQLLGVPYLALAAGPLLLQTVSFLFLGVALLRVRQFMGGYRTRWVGIPVILIGLLPFTYPIAHDQPFEWICYWLAGVLQIMTGAGMITLLLDGTAHQLELKNAELLRLDEMKNSFLSTISHELRTPLTAMKGALWIVQEGHAGPVSESQGEMLDMVSTNSDRLLHLINDILDFAKMESRMMTYHPQEVDLREVATLAGDSCAQLFNAKRIVLRRELGDEPLIAMVDGDKIARVLINLLSNASKFTPEGGEVLLRCRLEAGSIRLEVKDTGIGIPETYHHRIFDRFFQIDGSHTRKEGGTGLGLAICKAIVEEGHQGRIEVISEEGLGSTFAVRLPAPSLSAPSPAPASPR